MEDDDLAGLWIDGRPVAGSGAPSAVVNPADGSTIATVSQAGPEDLDAAVAAARRSFVAAGWRGATDRAATLLRLAGRIREHAEEIAALESRNVGKPIRDSRGEVAMAADCFQYYAGQIASFGGETIPVGAQGIGMTFREPVGVCALLVPWNFPLAIAAWKVAPALALGNSVVLKPATATPLTALRLARLAAEAGVPDGVLNVIAGPGGKIGAELTRHPDVRKVSFTGSTEVGSEVMRAAADDVKRVSLELGGKSASIVFSDADLDEAAGSVFSVFGNAGQDCCARSRVLVERTIYDAFVEQFVARARAIRMGDPMDEATEMGPLISRDHRARVDGYVTWAVREGARLCAGGRPGQGDAFDRGSYYEPTVFADVTPAMTIAQEEVFGPVAAIMPFDDEADAIRLANDSQYGLSGSVWTRDVARALRVVRAFETGVISVNSSHSVHLEMPFGGVKRSGIGRELGRAALDHYSDLKSVFISTR